LPYEGGLFDQDPLLLDYFDIISYEINKIREEEQKRANAKARR